MPPPRRLFELHAPAWLARQAERFERELTLASAPDEAWIELAELGFDHVWVMGVWRRSPASRREARAPEAMRRWRRALPDLRESDVLGSPYAIHDYSLDPRLGGIGDLARLRERLNRLGLGLILDFVPNHLAVDHPWVEAHPMRLVRGTGAAVERHPEWFFRGPQGELFAHGRDPNFAPWNDTVQIDWTSAEARDALARELIRIGEVADGVRVDMAMLGLADVVDRTWSEVVARAPDAWIEPWHDILTRVRAARPGLVLIAEAYWGREPDLLKLGFDYAYDKTIYDLLVAEKVEELASYVRREPNWLDHGLHFAENHDEERAQMMFGPERARAATLAALTLPGLALVHDGQLEGAKRRAPIHLARAPRGDFTPGEEAFYRRLLAVTRDVTFRDGTWSVLDVTPPLLAWTWRLGRDARVVLLHASQHSATVEVDLGWALPPAIDRVVVIDELGAGTVGVVGTGVEAAPVRLHLDRWGTMVLRIQPATE